MKKLVLNKNEEVNSIEEAIGYKYICTTHKKSFLVPSSDGGYTWIYMGYKGEIMWEGITFKTKEKAINVFQQGEIYCTNDINEFADWLKE